MAQKQGCGEVHKDDLTKEEMEQFLKEKEQIRQIVGRIGGKPTARTKVFNISMFVLIIATFVAIPFLGKEYHTIALEAGIFLLSLKIFLLLHNEAKVNHFQFWMLSSLEWRMNDMAKRLIRIDSAFRNSSGETGQEEKWR